MMKEKFLRPCRKMTDQFIIASILTVLAIILGGLLYIGPLENMFVNMALGFLGGDAAAAGFLSTYFGFITIWVVAFLIVLVFKDNRPMMRAVGYSSPLTKHAAAGNGNRSGNNITGLILGLALGFGTNGFCVLMSVLLGDIHLEYSGFRLVPFAAFLICVFIQSAAEELINRWYLYQKLRRRYRSPWIAIVVNAAVFAFFHLLNPGITLLAVIQIVLIGVLFSLFVYYYNGLWIAMAFHAGWNFTQSILFGLPNSGIVSAYSVFRLDAASAENGLFYNVNFGVEGSGGAVAVLLLAGLVVLLKNRGKTEHTDVWEEKIKKPPASGVARDAAS